MDFINCFESDDVLFFQKEKKKSDSWKFEH